MKGLLATIRELILSARKAVVHSVDLIQVLTNFEIGRRIVEHEQQGAERAEYGKALLKELSTKLTAEFGRGFSRSNLQNMRKFYLTYADRLPEKCQMPSGKLPLDRKSQTSSGELTPIGAYLPIWQIPSSKSPLPFTLSWSQYVFLVSIDNPEERQFYEIEAAAGGWTMPELKRQFNSGLFERLALSRDKDGIRQLAAAGQIVTRPEDLLKEAYVLEFLGLDAKATYSESDLESAIIDKLEHFLLELGKGFLFEARQKRFTFAEEHFFVDLVFYNRLLRCYVLIDLKIGKLTHQHLGQMQMYVNYFDRFVKLADEHPTVGIVLCKKKHDALVEITLPKDANIHAKEYQLYLPSKELLRRKLNEWSEEAGAVAGGGGMNATDLLATLPEGWRRVPLKAVCYYTVSNVDKHSFEDEMPVRLCNYTDVYKNDRVSPELDLMKATATEAEIDQFHLEIGDVVITKDSESWDDIAIPAYVEATADDFVCGYHLAFLRPHSRLLDGRFLFRCIQSRPVLLQLELEATGVTRYGLPKGAIGSALLPLPSLEIQRRIADYLDRETARIDALVAEKERMLDLLEEKRAALISRAVTRGLNPDASLKPSGLDWLGDIPAHWETRRGKFLFTQFALPVCDDDEIVTCFRDGMVTLRRNRREDGFTNAVLELGYQGIRVGQLVLHSMDAFAGAIGISNSNGKCSPEYIICNPKSEKVVSNYFGVLLRVMALRGYIQAACTAVRERAPRIRFSHLSNMLLPLPPRDEQEDIVRSLQVERSNTVEIEQALRNSINLLKERRAALITAAVTGQISPEEMAA